MTKIKTVSKILVLALILAVIFLYMPGAYALRDEEKSVEDCYDYNYEEGKCYD